MWADIQGSTLKKLISRESSLKEQSKKPRQKLKGALILKKTSI